MFYSVIREVRVGFHVHLLENARPIRTDGFYAQEKLVRNLRHRQATGELAKDDSRAVTATVIKSLIEWELVEIIGASIVITARGRSIDELY